MRVTYSPEADALAIQLREGPYEASQDVAPGVTVDIDRDGNILAVEILGARAKGIDPDALSFEILRPRQPAPA